jgi:branched-subunit amino acid aminotransferase/4-amino-4-deoxychorismate lyase
VDLCDLEAADIHSWASSCTFRAAGNYGSSLTALLAAKGEGFTDIVYLDAKTDNNLEELSAANIFTVKV